jgi:hypothetical protein
MEPTVGATGVVRDEFIDHEAFAGQFGNSASHPQMHRAHRVGIRKRGRLERTPAQNDVDLITADAHGRLESLALHSGDHGCNGVIRRTSAESLTTTRATAHRFSRISRPDHLAQKQAEPLVGSGGTPPAIGAGMNAVIEAWPSTPGNRSVLFGHELGSHQLRKMLSDRIVIEPEMLGQLGDINRRT